MPELVRTTRHGDVAVLEIANPPVNALSPGVPEALRAALDAAEQASDVAAIIIRGAGRMFVAGADISTLEQAAWGTEGAAPDWHDLLAGIEDCAKPVTMAIHGTALGGGLELAMAGHYRVAVANAQIGQPEVNLGIIPGAEGTQRLPRLAGVSKALDLCVTGAPILAKEAAAHGIVDEIVEGDLTEAAVAFARRKLADAPHVKTRDRIDRLGSRDENGPLFSAARELARKVRGRQRAPLRAIEAIEAAASLPFDDGCRRERELFLDCVRSEEAKALIHVFFAERAASKLPAAARDLRVAPVSRVAIVGAGTMGSGIAMACANAGLEVALTDASEQALEGGLRTIRTNYERSVVRGKLSEEAVAERIERIRPESTVSAFAGQLDADVVIEAVFEDLALKQEVFRTVDTVAPPGCLLATNTSTLDIDAIAKVTSRPEAVVGLHFFSPAHVMRLVEVVRGQATGVDTLARGLAFAKQLRKLGVVVGNGPGFVGNRLLFPYMYEAQFLVEEGATPAEVDRALTQFGMAMGIFAVDDLAGLDVGWRVRRAMGHFQDPNQRAPLVHDRLVEMERLGQKRGKGWHRYEDGRTPIPDGDVEALIRTLATDAGIAQRRLEDEEIVDRTIYALINEGARALTGGVAARASDIDVIYVNGYGFPRWRGGPMFYADRVGLARVLDRITAFHRDHGERWRPAPLIEELAASGRTFRDLDRQSKG